MPRYRRGAVFVMDVLTASTRIDRNQRVRILYLAELLERKTKGEGRRNGVLGYVGLSVLRALLLGCLNASDGLCCPSYDALQRMTGLCRQSISNGLARLEASGVIAVTRRLVRERVIIGGTLRLRAVQGSNLYAFSEPGPWAEHLPLPEPRKKVFPVARMIAMLGRSMSFPTESTRQGETHQFAINKRNEAMAL